MLPWLATGAVWASTPFFDDVPVVLSASRLRQSVLDAPAAVTVIDRATIAASGFVEIHDLLRLVPGFLVADWPGGDPAVTHHGLGGAFDSRIKVMIDGQTVNAPPRGGVAWASLPVRVEDLERIEVVRGPNGAAYGANALQGVVNLITRAPETESSAHVLGRVGRGGFFESAVRLNSVTGGAFDWRLSASRRAQQPFQASAAATDGRWYGGESVQRNVINFNASRGLNTRDRLGLLMAVADGTDRRGHGADPFDPARRVGQRMGYLRLDWTRALAAGGELALRYHHQNERHEDAWSVAVDGLGLAGPPLQVNHDVRARRDSFEIQVSAPLGERWTAMGGFNAVRKTLKAPGYMALGDTYVHHTYNLFGGLNWQASAALRLDASATLTRHPYSGTLLSPRIAANYRVQPEHVLRVAAGRSYRASALLEGGALETIRQGDLVRSVQTRSVYRLQPEEVRYIELGYGAELPRLGARVDARLFNESYRALIGSETCFNPPYVGDAPGLPCPPLDDAHFAPLRPAQKSFLFINDNRFSLRGVELSLDWRRPGWGRVLLAQAFMDVAPHGPLLEPDIPRSVPRRTTSVLLVKDLPRRWQASLGYYHLDEMHWLGDGDRVPARDRFDIHVSRAFGPAWQENAVTLTVQSAGGRYPEFHDGKYRQEAQVFVGLQLGW